MPNPVVALPQRRLSLLGVGRLLVDVAELLLETARFGVGGVAQEADRAALFVRLLVHVNCDPEVPRTCDGCLLGGRHGP